jgi:hypothetical protein
MPIIATVKQPEQWVLEVNGGYDILFTEVTLAADAVDGEVITAPVNGIVSKGGKTGDKVRVMVRGNPTKVDSAQLTGVTTGLDASIVLV